MPSGGAPAASDRPLPMTEGLPGKASDVGAPNAPRPNDDTVSQGLGDRPMPSSGAAGDTPTGAAPEPTAPGPSMVPVEVAPTELDSSSASQSDVRSPHPSAPEVSTPELATPDPSTPDPGDRFGSAPVPSPQ
jgi:hypothetical protein